MLSVEFIWWQLYNYFIKYQIYGRDRYDERTYARPDFPRLQNNIKIVFLIDKASL